MARIILLILVLVAMGIVRAVRKRRAARVREDIFYQITKAHDARARIKCLLYANVVDVNKKDKSGLTPLMRAADRDELDIVSYLIRAGADLNARDNSGGTVLFYSYGFHRGSLEMVQLLLRAGVDVNAADNEGNTVLMYACNIGSVEMVQILLEAGADVHRVDKQGRTALQHIRTGKDEVYAGYELPFHPDDVKKMQDLLHQYGAE